MSDHIESFAIFVSIVVVLIVCLVVYFMTKKVDTKDTNKTNNNITPVNTTNTTNTTNNIPAINKDLSPMIVLPGLGGTNLDYTLDENFSDPACNVSSLNKLEKIQPSLWINPLGLLFQKKCFLEMMKPIYNKEDKTLKNLPGLSVFPKANYFGDPLSSICLAYLFNSTTKCFPATDYSKNFVNFFTNKGYTVGYNLFIPGYDFRLVPYEPYGTQFFESIKTLIENTYQTTGKKIFLLGHSLGTLLGNMFLNKMTQKWKDKYIESFIPISPAYDGAPKSLRTVLSGDNFGLPNFIRTSNNDFIYPERSIAGLAATIPLLPKMYGPTNCKNEGNGEAVTLLKDSGQKIVYNVNDYKDGIIGIIRAIAKETNTPELYTFADIVVPIAKEKEKYVYSDPKVKVYQIIVRPIPSESSYIYDLSSKGLNEDPIFIGTVSGDHDVPIYGSQIPEIFKWRDVTNKIFPPLDNLNHFNAYVNSTVVYNYIFNIVSGNVSKNIC